LRRECFSAIRPASATVATRLFRSTLIELALLSAHVLDPCDRYPCFAASTFIAFNASTASEPVISFHRSMSASISRRRYFFPVLGELCFAARANRGARGISELRRDGFWRVARPENWYSEGFEISQWELRSARTTSQCWFSYHKTGTAGVLAAVDGGWWRYATLDDARKVTSAGNWLSALGHRGTGSPWTLYISAVLQLGEEREVLEPPGDTRR